MRKRILILITVFALASLILASAVGADLGFTKLRNLIVTNEAVFTGAMTGTSTLDVDGAMTAGSTLDVTGAMTAASLAATGALSAGTTNTVGTFLIMTPGATQILTAGGTLSPVASNQPISSTAAIGLSSITIPTSGTLLRLINVGSYTITFTDTGTLKLSANIALGQYDVLALMSDGTNLIQVATSDN